MMMETDLQSSLPLRALARGVLPILVMGNLRKGFMWAEVSWRENKGIGFLHVARKADGVQTIGISTSGSLIRRVDGARWRALGDGE